MEPASSNPDRVNLAESLDDRHGEDIQVSGSLIRGSEKEDGIFKKMFSMPTCSKSRAPAKKENPFLHVVSSMSNKTQSSKESKVRLRDYLFKS